MIATGLHSLMELPEGRFDGHCHVFDAGRPMAEGRRYTPGYDATPEELCSHLKAFNLRGALLVQPSFYGSDNSYMLETLDALQGRDDLSFRGVVVLDPGFAPDLGALKALAARGITGLRLNLLRRAEGFDHGLWQPLLSAVDSLGWHIELHVEEQHLPRLLPEFMRRYSKVVLDHYGLVTSTENNDGLRAILDQPRDRLWVKTSAVYRVHPRADRSKDVARMAPLRDLLAEHLGDDRLIWGSDWPFTQFEHQMNYDLAHRLAG